MKQIVTFGKYLLLERISVGGMAEVFKAKGATAEPFGRTLAIKKILPSMAEDADFIQMFIDEARIAGQLNHPNIAQIYELGRVDDAHFIAMEFVWGKDLLQIQNRFRRLKATMPFPMAAFCAAKISEALDYAHRKNGADGKPLGIIHRDVSPQNVLISYDGEVKVIDFGIAKAASRSTKTQAGVLKGKFGYMSPEQVGGVPIDRRSDIFAIGTILYEMITAERLFLGESDFATLEKVRNVDVPPPSVAVPTCPPAVEKIILKSIARDPAQRYQWASEMQKDLEQYLASLPQPFTPKNLGTWMQEQFATEQRREALGLDELLRAAADNARAQSGPVRTNGLTPRGAAGRNDFEDQPTLLESDIQEAAPAASTDFQSESTLITHASVSEVMARGVSPEAAATIAAGGDAGFATEATRIIDSGPVQAAARPGSAARSEELPSQATAILDTSSLNLPPMATGPAPGVRARPPGSQLDAHPITSHIGAPLPFPAPRAASTLWKDILLGCLVAAALIGAGLGVRALRAGSRARGTLVVMVSPPSSAHVFLDGKERGLVEAKENALALKDVAVGVHQLRVSGTAGEGEESVRLASPDDVKIVTISLKGSAPPPGAPEVAIAEPAPGATAPAATTPTPAKEPGATPTPSPPTPAPATVPSPTTASPSPTTASPSPTSPSPAPDKPPAATPASPASPIAAVAQKGDVKPPSATTPTTAPSAPAPTPAAVPSPQSAGVKTSPTATAKTPAAATTPSKTAPSPSLGHLVVKTDPPGADVNVNGKPAGQSPVDVTDVPLSKSVRVTIRKRGFKPVVKSLAFDKQRDQALDLLLVADGGAAETPAKGDKADKGDKAAPAAAAAGGGANGYLVANTQPWSKVMIDGKDTGRMTPIPPHSKMPLKPGKHVVTFIVDGKKFPFDVEIKPGQDFKLIKTLSGP